MTSTQLLHTCAGKAHKYDFSLPLPQMYALVEDVREMLGRVSSDIHVCGYGHFGDGNLHLNVSDGRCNRDDVRAPSLLPSVLRLTTEFLGSLAKSFLPPVACIGVCDSRFQWEQSSAVDWGLQSSRTRTMISCIAYAW